MEDDDLAQAPRLEQLKAQGGGGRGGGSSSGGGSQEQKQCAPQSGPVQSNPSEDARSPHANICTYDFRQQESEARASILQQILEPEAADRLGRIRLVKESRARDVEDRLIMLARSGQLRSKVTETQLRELLEAVAEKGKEEKIVVSRRKGGWDDEDDDDLFKDL
ncbi:hypothetical protein MBM_06294 [Drepanopeziza brunnea f. sp. 'multigermtubi' MB_m1]|uniref:DNA-binding TFAR19-related protein n=1 Tax=Marssonina brunnea f. sp. multigermtubi (strain MB_m1) TaxID=1072389 RepID=K1WRM3_MARBU|nr:uncharacterized protein MBM_06294 [Drepanopeziza brunnea f. sp. 'multigermtubi' MB_m1]EKD15666.1 hypothetical protein MBM_06294 [Drepanopeziza brunnea f. sp. 'multigermtubi' MB_m1]